jgi:hypothetical protein
MDGVILNEAVFPAERSISRAALAWGVPHEIPGPLVKARGFGMNDPGELQASNWTITNRPASSINHSNWLLPPARLTRCVVSLSTPMILDLPPASIEPSLKLTPTALSPPRH